ncbi:AAA family ATPase [Jeotgalibaca porci]|uniref:AAA family ATPase n=1 Tax=Jeotgalibaca porci TaxID=1868793 RepID=UPI0035A10F55
MKKILINTITYENFKGLSSYTLNLAGKNAIVSGRNALGKTTLFDGFYWLLFGKDSTENAKFDVKPVDSDGLEILGKEPVVEAVLLIDGNEVTLRRELRETWSTVRGRVEAERKSDTTKYYINGVPCKTQKEYQEFIGTIIDENIFKMLTNPFTFNGLHWKEKRDILMSLVLDVSDDDVIASNEALADLGHLLTNHTADDQKAIVKAKLKELKKDIDGMTVRLDEAERAIPNTGDLNESELKGSLQRLNKKLDKLKEEQIQIENGGATVQLQSKLDEIQHEMNALKIKQAQSNHLAVSNLKNALNDSRDSARTVERNLDQVIYKLHDKENLLQKKANQRKELLDNYRTKMDQTFDEHRSSCAMCGQELPADQVEKMKEEFNLKKANEIEGILSSGKEIKSEIDATAVEIEELKKEREEILPVIENMRNRIDELEKEISCVDVTNQTDFSELPEYQRLVDDSLALRSKIYNDKESKAELIQDSVNKQKEVTFEISQVNELLSKISVAVQQRNRLEELKKKHVDLVNTYNEFQGYEYLLEEYTRTRVKLMEEQINAKFKYAQFKLFNLQKNGGVEEVCEATYKGVAFSRNLNNAARINVGLDIINTLSDAYNVLAPIFVDNAESVNNLISTKSQIISLVVSNDTELELALGN